MHSKGEHVPYFHPTTEEVCAWHYINSPRWFENLRTIKLAADYRMDDFVDLFRVEKMIRPIMDGLQFLLSQNCNLHRSPFGNPHWQIQIEFPNLFICTFHWREDLDANSQITLQSTRAYSIDDERRRRTFDEDDVPWAEEDFYETAYRTGWDCLWFERAVIFFYHCLTEGLGPLPRSVTLKGFMIRTIDIGRLCGHEVHETISPVDSLVLENCTLLPNTLLSEDLNAERLRGDLDLEVFARAQQVPLDVRELSFIDIRADPLPEKSWRHFFQALLEQLRFQPLARPLQSLHFERVEGVFFDWDGDGQLDNGERLPLIIREVGLLSALEKMIECYRYCPQPGQGHHHHHDGNEDADSSDDSTSDEDESLIEYVSVDANGDADADEAWPVEQEHGSVPERSEDDIRRRMEIWQVVSVAQ